MSQITADTAVQTSNEYMQETRDTQTNSPFECSKYCGQIFPDKAAWNIHLMKDHTRKIGLYVIVTSATMNDDALSFRINFSFVSSDNNYYSPGYVCSYLRLKRYPVKYT